MTISITEKEGKTFVIAPDGNLDYIISDELDDTVTEIAAKAEKMIIDLGNVNYIASAGLRVLLNADEIMGEKSGLVLTNVNDYVMEIFDMTDFTSILTIE